MSRSRLPPIKNTADDETDGDGGFESHRSEGSMPESVQSRRSNKANAPDKPRRKKKPNADDSAQRKPQASAGSEQPEYESGEENEVSVPRRAPKKKRKLQTPVNAEDSPTNSIPANSSQRTTKTPRKRKRKAQADVGSNEIGFASELHDLEEDIVDDTTGHTVDPVTSDTGAIDPKVTIAVMRSEPTQKMFTETKRGFKATDKTKLAMKRTQAAEACARLPAETQRQDTIQFALKTHRVFRTCAIFLQGMFSGLTLWQIIASYMLIIHGALIFCEYYNILALPVQSIYYFFFAVATVSALDRYDLAHPTRKLLMKSITLQAGTVCVVFYFCGLIVSLGTAPLDEKIALNDTSLWDSSQSGCDWLCTWQILNVIRGVLPILGWFVISLSPTTDRLAKSLISANDDILQPMTFGLNSRTGANERGQTGVAPSVASTY